MLTLPSPPSTSPQEVPLSEPTPADPVSVILEEAAVQIEKSGWTQGEATDRYGRICALQAISYAAINVLSYDVGYLMEARLRFMCHLGVDDYHKGGRCIALWNDAAGRTKEEVCRKLREAAAS